MICLNLLSRTNNKNGDKERKKFDVAAARRKEKNEKNDQTNLTGMK